MSVAGTIRAFVATTLEAATPSERPDVPWRLYAGNEPLAEGAMDSRRERDFCVRMAGSPQTLNHFGAGCLQLLDVMTVEVLYILHGAVAALDDQMDADSEDIATLLIADLVWPAGMDNIVYVGGERTAKPGADIMTQTLSFELTYTVT
jgi:hypothetical protein